jgi:hypothetical protein
MWSTEKKINKWLISLVIGSAILGLGGLSMSPKGKSWWRRILDKAKERWHALWWWSKTP